MPELSETVDAAILKALEKDPNRRFSTCTELAVALGCQFLTGPAPLPRILLETEITRMGGRYKTRFYPFSFRRPKTHLALEPEALWAIHRSELVRWPASTLHSLKRRGLRGLSFQIRGASGKQNQWIRFKRSKERQRWLDELGAVIASADSGASVAAGSDQPREAPLDVMAAEPRVEPVVLLKGRPATRFQLLGMVEAKAPNRRRAENGLTVRAAMMGADAVTDLNIERLPGFLRSDQRASGMAVRCRPRGAAGAQVTLVLSANPPHPDTDVGHGDRLRRRGPVSHGQHDVGPGAGSEPGHPL